MSKSILSFFKKSTDSESSIESTVEPVNNVNSVDNEAPVNSVDTVHDDLASGSRPVHSENSGPSCHISQYRPDRIFQFPKSIRGKRGKTDSADLFFETVLMNVIQSCFPHMLASEVLNLRNTNIQSYGFVNKLRLFTF